MIKNTRVIYATLLLLLLAGRLCAQSAFKFTENFGSGVNLYPKTGRGLCQISDNKLITKDAYLSFGESNWADYELKFRARVPASETQVQICAGFRETDRDDRYFLMLKGGIQKDLYLARQGYMAKDDFLAIRPLNFQPEPGTWYDFKIQVTGARIRIFLNDEEVPRIDIVDPNTALSPAGKVTLGGSWITNEFESLSITAIPSGQLNSVPVREFSLPIPDKEVLRKQQRASYQPMRITPSLATRSECSLNGKWLFSPGYETDDKHAASPASGDKDWHVMSVPAFWTPSRVWLHGEKYNGDSKGVADNYYQEETARCQAYTFDYKKTITAWYRQWVELPGNIRGKNMQLAFDAVSKVAEVWINGKMAGKHTGMFGDFKIDAGGLLHPGKNLIAVKVTKDYIINIKDADKIAGVAVTVEVTQKMVQDLAHGFFAEDPAGIWQPVRLIVTNPVHIEDVFIKPDLTGADIDVTVKNNDATARIFDIKSIITGSKQRDTIYQQPVLSKQIIQGGQQKTFSFRVAGLHPKLWSPEHPDLYDFDLELQDSRHQVLDNQIIRSGFRTFKAIGDYLYLNGNRYWLRGGNQTPMALAPNDTALADKFCKLMKAGNIMVTRTHTVPYSETWMNASDENGIGVSYEGTWPWLFLGSSMPEEKLIRLWEEEFMSLLKKYRNHPSLLIWTMNNEMKFYDNDPDFERTKLKMKIISDVVKEMRRIDATRPIVFDSNYKRNIKKFGAEFFNDIDDGDIDDVHAYLNWYDDSIFEYFKGEWQKKNKNEGRPLISQEMSTGYTDETGHATRFYNYVHQNPSALAGNYTYEYNDPMYFMRTQAFITKELAEALRRSNDKAAGILHFAAITWFTNVYSAQNIKPFPVYYDVQKALQPVLVSAELWGRHFYAGSAIPAKICVINDQEDGTVFPASLLTWKMVNESGVTIASGQQEVPPVAHYTRKWLAPELKIPDNLFPAKINGRLELSLTVNDQVVSANSYDLQFANKDEVDARKLIRKKIAVVDLNNSIIPSLDYLGVRYTNFRSASEVADQRADLYIFSGLDSINTNPGEIKKIRQLIRQGAKVFVSRSGAVARQLFPEYIRGLLVNNGEVAMMDIPESPVFDGIEPLETRNFNNNKAELPSVISGAFRIIRNPNITALASFTRVHGYLDGSMEEKAARLDKLRGFPVVKINENGSVILSEIRVEKAITDPVAAKLLLNMMNELTK